MTPAAPTLHFIVPIGIDDPAAVSGGNVFDRRVREGLPRHSWGVRMQEVDATEGDVAVALAAVPEGATVLVDGLIARRAPGAIEAAAERLRIAVLAHMVSASFPDADPAAVVGERRAMRAARVVIATSEWSRSEIVRRGIIAADRVVVATPGCDPAPTAVGTRTAGRILCVGVVAPHKGQDALVEALAALDGRGDWSCTIAGSISTHPEYAGRVSRHAAATGIADRVSMPGVLGERELEQAYLSADLLVAPSRVESYGMAIAEALRRGIPVVATDVGGIPATVAPGDGVLLIPPDQPQALRDALARWLAEPGLRAGLKDAARRGRSRFPQWSDTVTHVAAALAAVR